MKCPKCGYVSFDYNQICPKCSKDIGGEQQKLNLPAFKPDPPYLLEALTGAASASRIGLEAGTFVESPDIEPVMNAAMDDTGVMEKTSVLGRDVEGFRMEMGDEEPELPAMELGDSVESEISAVDLSQIEIQPGKKGKDELTLDLGDFAEDSEAIEPTPEIGVEKGSGTVAISAPQPLENTGYGTDPTRTQDAEISLDLDGLSEDSLEAAMAVGKEDAEMILDLEELSENAQDLDEISFDPGTELDDGSFDFSEMELDESIERLDVEELPLGDAEMPTVELDSKAKGTGKG